MPKTEFFTLESEFDRLPISVMAVYPDGEIRALVQLSHGMCEHKERYLPFMEYLAGKGLMCVINDHRGHGASVLKQEDLGYFYKNGDEGLLRDLHQITLWMRAKWPDKKLFLFGHSMGSLSVRAYADAYDKDIDSLVVCGSPGYNPAWPVGLLLIDIIQLFKGDHYRSPLLHKMSTGKNDSRFPGEGPGAWLSANRANTARFGADPLCGFDFTLNGNRALMHLMQRAYGLKAPRGNPGLPVHFYSGADDACAPDRKGFDDAVNRMKKAGYSNVQGYMFPGLRHEILNEANREEVFEKIYTEAFDKYIQ